MLRTVPGSHGRDIATRTVFDLDGKLMSEKYPEPSLIKVKAVQEKRDKKFLIAIPAIAICMFIWGGWTYGYGDFIPDILVSVAQWMLLPLVLFMAFNKCPKCDRYNCHISCSVCKFRFPK